MSWAEWLDPWGLGNLSLYFGVILSVVINLTSIVILAVLKLKALKVVFSTER